MFQSVCICSLVTHGSPMEFSSCFLWRPSTLSKPPLAGRSLAASHAKIAPCCHLPKQDLARRNRLLQLCSGCRPRKSSQELSSKKPRVCGAFCVNLVRLTQG